MAYANRMDQMLEAQMRAANLENRHVASLLGVSKSKLRRIRNGEAEMSLSEAHCMASLLGISLDRLYLVAPHH